MLAMEEFLELAETLADQSQALILDYFQKGVAVDMKADRTPVTEADREAERLMRKAIEARFPEHGILGEELGTTHPDAPYQWVLDPIDGTLSFISGVPLFGTLIALKKDGKPILGILNLPVLGERLIGMKDRVNTWNGQEVHVSQTSSLEEASLCVTDMRHVNQHQNGSAFATLAEKVYLSRTWGDCFMYGLLARGKIDIAVDAIMNPWDIQALIPIIEGAGGIITDYQGNAPENGNSMIAANPALHAKVISWLNPAS